MEKHQFTAKLLTADTWPDLVELFGENGACGGCWCMYFRLPHREFKANCGDQNRTALHQTVVSGSPVGMLAYAEELPVGWCAVAPRSVYTKLATSRYYKSVDDLPVWSITCFFIRKGYRRQGLTRFLAQQAVEFALSQGAVAVEAYPLVAEKEHVPDSSAYTGFSDVFSDLGFVIVADRSGKHPIMRFSISQ